MKSIACGLRDVTYLIVMPARGAQQGCSLSGDVDCYDVVAACGSVVTSAV